MEIRIWRELVQILFNRTDLVDVLKPFFENLRNENINNEKYLPLLKTFSNYHRKVLYQMKILTNERFHSLVLNRTFININNNNNINNNINIEEIVAGDKIRELQQLIQETDISKFNTIIKPFREVEKMKIPLIQYCIMKNARECFKYLLVNGYDNPNQYMKEYFQEDPRVPFYRRNIINKRYEWDSMSTAIFFENKEIIKILEEKGMEKGKDPSHIEAAILSYRNIIVEEILNDIKINENNEEFKKTLNNALVASSKCNNIKGVEVLIKKGAKINSQDIHYLNF